MFDFLISSLTVAGLYGLMALGLNNLEIADRLVVSRSTVKFHVSSVLCKLDATTRTEAVAIAMQHHLVDPVIRKD